MVNRLNKTCIFFSNKLINSDTPNKVFFVLFTMITLTWPRLARSPWSAGWRSRRRGWRPWRARRHSSGAAQLADTPCPTLRCRYLTILLSTYLHYNQVTGPGVRRGRLEDDGEGGYIQWVTYTGDTADQGAAVTCTVLQVL